MKHQTLHLNDRRRSTRSAFTLVEILVALGVMMLLLVIVLVPVNLGLNLFHIGKARAEISQANQLVLNQLSRELRQAVYVYPNEAMPGVANAPSVANTSRIDFILPALDNKGAVLTPTRASNYLVTYYARRLKQKDEDGAEVPYDVFSNPIVLWRAQYPAPIIRTQTDGEPTNLDNASTSNTDTLASHTQVTPRDMALIVSDATTSFQPSSSFICDDANGDGKIDRVTISLLLAKYDSVGAAGVDGDGTIRSQQIRQTRTVELPNIR